MERRRDLFKAFGWVQSLRICSTPSGRVECMRERVERNWDGVNASGMCQHFGRVQRLRTGHRLRDAFNALRLVQRGGYVERIWNRVGESGRAYCFFAGVLKERSTLSLGSTLKAWSRQSQRIISGMNGPPAFWPWLFMPKM